MGIIPGQLSVVVLLFVPVGEFGCARLHWRWQRALGLVSSRPRALGQHFDGELYPVNIGPLILFSKLDQLVLTEPNIFEHLRHLVHLVHATLHLQFLKHLRFCLLRNTRLVQQTFT